MTRLKSELWVRAYMWRLEGEGVPTVIVRRGNTEAGAIYILINRLDRTVRLFGPAPAGLAEAAGERSFVALFEGRFVPEIDANERLMREAEFDPDLWVVEAEDRAGRHFLEDWLADDAGF
ncbi:hypothetical protein A7A08_02161 [Methyloligella halotolerans]|uniref:DUF1491 domain-containing protein n=1 Tax=Methyloligella halotolerans TaxID=1177755 RepID=A0A1E2RXB5_9HYPH|nr:DUF1491 family protein [Methyloligella halotolerans]ODA66864.1 hypothetical protein A7A08_02161 [Methyloligella halotolerans]